VVAQGNPHVPILVSYPAFRVLASRLAFEKLLLAVDYKLVVIATGVNLELVTHVNEFPHSNLFSTNTGSNVAPVLEKKTK
jgi:hypothetical protein